MTNPASSLAFSPFSAPIPRHVGPVGSGRSTSTYRLANTDCVADVNDAAIAGGDVYVFIILFESLRSLFNLNLINQFVDRHGHTRHFNAPNAAVSSRRLGMALAALPTERKGILRGAWRKEGELEEGRIEFMETVVC